MSEATTKVEDDVGELIEILIESTIHLEGRDAAQAKDQIRWALNKLIDERIQKCRVGDMVILASGGPFMSVEAIEEESAVCRWFDGEKMARAWFPIVCIRRVSFLVGPTAALHMESAKAPDAKLQRAAADLMGNP